MTNRLRSAKASFVLSCPPCKLETDAFHWIRKDSLMHEWITGIDFTYQNGFTVYFVIPWDWSSEKLQSVIDTTCLDYFGKFNGGKSVSFRQGLAAD